MRTDNFEGLTAACRKGVSPLLSLPRRLGVLFVLVAGTVAAVASGTATGGPAARIAYQVIQLSPDLGATGFINNRDQVVFTETRDGVFRPRLYDAGRVRELGTLGGTNAYAVGLNDHGQVVGASEFSPGNATTHAFRWTRGAGMIDLDPAGSADSVAIAINNKGNVVGRAWFGEPGQTARHAFHWTPQTGIVDLTPGASVSSANDINDAGTAVGFVGVPSGDPEGLPFRWTRSEGVVPLTTFSSRGSDATDINAVGQITGTSTFPGQDGDRAFFWSRQDGIVNLGSGSGQQSEAGRLNDKGLVIGVVEDPFESTRPLAWTRAGGLVEFAGAGVDGVPRDVNNAGQVVGDLESRAFAWTRAGGVVDLNTRIPGAPPGLVAGLAVVDRDGGARRRLLALEDGPKALAEVLHRQHVAHPAGAHHRHVDAAEQAVHGGPQVQVRHHGAAGLEHAADLSGVAVARQRRAEGLACIDHLAQARIGRHQHIARTRVQYLDRLGVEGAQVVNIQAGRGRQGLERGLCAAQLAVDGLHQRP